MLTKMCKTCEKEKSISEFYKSGERYVSACAECNKIACKEYYQKNRERLLNRAKKNHLGNRERNRKRFKKYSMENKDKITQYNKIYYEENKEKAIEYRKRYYKENGEMVRQKRKQYRKKNIELIKKSAHLDKPNRNRKRREKYKTDIGYKLERILRSRLTKTLMDKIKKENTFILLGCSIEYLKNHIEERFKPGMSWDNYNHETWHLDHILPCASFDLSDINQQRKCFHYSNLQPLWAKENMEKRSKILCVS